MPRVSVIVPSWNTSPYIQETLDSVFAQTFSDYEVIVINDGSPDTPVLENMLAPYGNRIIYHKQENGGLASARNSGLDLAKGELIGLLDSDDAWLPQLLERQVASFDQRPKLAMQWTDGYIFGGTPRDGHRLQQYSRMDRPVTLEKLLKLESVPLCSSVVCRRGPLEAVGRFDGSLRHGEDSDLWLRLAAGGYELDMLDEPLVRYRIRPDSLSMKHYNVAVGGETVYRKLQRMLPPDDAMQQVIEAEIRRVWRVYGFEMARRYLHGGQPKEAEQVLREYTRRYRSLPANVLRSSLRVAPALTLKLFQTYQSIKGSNRQWVPPV